MRDTEERQRRKSEGRRSKEDIKLKRQRQEVQKSLVMGKEKSSHQNPFLRRYNCAMWKNIFNLFFSYLTLSKHLWLGQMSFSFEKRKI